MRSENRTYRIGLIGVCSAKKLGTMAENTRQPKSPRSQSEKEVDQAVGHRIKSLRELKGDSQKDLGAKLGLSFQQIQKYENGKNRVSASTLQQIADLYDVDVEYFFGDFAQPRLSAYEQELLDAAGPAGSALARRIFAMVNNFDKIKDPEMREGLLKIARSFAKGEEDRRQAGGVEDPDAGDGTESDDGKP